MLSICLFFQTSELDLYKLYAYKKSVCLYSWDYPTNHNENEDKNEKYRSHSYDIYRSRSRHGHKYNWCKKFISMIWCWYIYSTKQHLSNIWSSIHEKFRNTETELKKKALFKGRIHCEMFPSEHFIKYNFRGISWTMKYFHEILLLISISMSLLMFLINCVYGEKISSDSENLIALILTNNSCCSKQKQKIKKTEM